MTDHDLTFPRKTRFVEFEGAFYVLIGIGFNQSLFNYYFHLIDIRDYKKYLNNESNYYTICIEMDNCREVEDENEIKLLKLLYL